MEEKSEPGNDNVSYSEKQDIPHPWPYLIELFDVVSSRNDSWQMCCVVCQPKNHELLAFKNSLSNLKQHI